MNEIRGHLTKKENNYGVNVHGNFNNNYLIVSYLGNGQERHISRNFSNFRDFGGSLILRYFEKREN